MAQLVFAAALSAGVRFFADGVSRIGTSVGSLAVTPPRPPEITETSTDLTLTEPISSRDLDPISVTTEPGGDLPGLIGRRRVGGRVVYSTRDAAGGDWLVIVILGARASVTNIYLDNLLISRDANGFVLTPPYNANSCQIRLYDGSQLTAPAELIAAGVSWGAQAVGREITFATVRINKAGNPTSYGAGVPNITFETTGFAAYDPRNAAHNINDRSTWSVTRNAALVAAGYLVHPLGHALPVSSVDWASFGVGATLCDVATALKAGGTEPQFESALYWLTGERHETVLARAGAAMGGGVYQVGKLWRCAVGAWSPPPVIPNITPAMYDAGGITFSDTQDIEASYNGVRALFTSPAHFFEERDAPQYQDATALSQDGGLERWLDLDLTAVTSQTQAQRIMRTRYRQARRGAPVGLELQFEAFDIVSDDIVTLTDDLAGFSFQTCRVINDALSSDWVVSLSLRTEDAAMYAWTAANDELPFVVAGTSSPAVTTTGSASGDTGALRLAGGLTYDASATAGTYAQDLTPPADATPFTNYTFPTPAPANGTTSYGAHVAISVEVAASPSLPAANYKARIVYRKVTTTVFSDTSVRKWYVTSISTETVTLDVVEAGGVCQFPDLQESISRSGPNYTFVSYYIDSLQLDTSQSGTDNWDPVLANPVRLFSGFDGVSLGSLTSAVGRGTLPTPSAPYVQSGGGTSYTLKTNQAPGTLSAQIELWAFDTLDTSTGALISTQVNSAIGASFAVSGPVATGKYYRARVRDSAGTVFGPYSNPCLIVFQ